MDNVLNMADVTSPDVGGPKKFSRRDFFKAVGIGLGGTALAVAADKGLEIASDPHFVNGLKVTKELTEAEISRDPERIFESRKLAMVWLFAETSAKYSKEMGLGGAGLNMEHYLYGNGEPVDISSLLEKVIETAPERFVSKLIGSAIHNKEDNVNRKVSPEKDYQFTNRALKELKSETGLKTVLDARELIGEWYEAYNAFGGAKYTLFASEADIVDQEGYGQKVVLENGIQITATDRYYWQVDHEIGLPSKSSEAAGDVSEKLFDQFYKSRNFVEKTINDMGLSDEQVDKIMEIYSIDKKDQLVSDLAPATYDLVSKSIESLTGKPDLVENDLNLLKKLGATEYEMNGQVNIPTRLEIVV